MALNGFSLLSLYRPCEGLDDAFDNVRERFARVDDDGVFWFFERCELALHQFFWEKMGSPML